MIPAIPIAALLLAAAPGILAQDQPDAAARRLALLEVRDTDAKAIARLAAALEDQDPLVARTAARLLARRGGAALPALIIAAGHDDMLVRRIAVIGMGSAGEDAVEPLGGALSDPHVLVRQAAVFALARVRPRSERIMELLAAAGKDELEVVRQAARQAIRSSFKRAAEIRLPKDGWKFKLDPERVGKDEKWFGADLDDAAWDDIEIEKAWQHFGYDYIGVAWYRRTIELLEMQKREKAELAFEGVDENAWVWVNGQYAGEHAIGPSGWDKPFWLDVTDLLRWGEENQITIRAMNTAMAGGIWRPASILVLELK